MSASQLRLDIDADVVRAIVAWSHRACYSHPRPLSIDGAAYTRKVRSRRGKGGRR